MFARIDITDADDAELLAATLSELVAGWVAELEEITDAHYDALDRYDGKPSK